MEFPDSFDCLLPAAIAATAATAATALGRDVFRGGDVEGVMIEV